MRYEQTFDSTPESIAAVRRFVREHTPGHADLELIVLLTTELATNAVVHAGTPFSVLIEVADTAVRVAVVDADPTLPGVVDRGERSTGGRGLKMVARAAADWGVERSGTGKQIWFAVGRAQP